MSGRRILRELTDREKEVYRLLLLAQSNKEISSALNISTRTVRFHISNILHKFRVTNRIELIVSSLARLRP